ncbi:hypothetical protein ACFV0T_07095 [Streptomyces sp. NPDC059582]|uniref:hypothetical protein n=1 Tax=Streptomyces sp. NPDC059582 TaxID=3346875 RepID=UPI0036AE8C01
MRWWIGGEEALLGEDEADSGVDWIDEIVRKWAWAWVDKLARDHEGRSSIQEWIRRRDELAIGKAPAQHAEPVAIPVPAEQMRFIEALRKMLQDNGLLNEPPPADLWEWRRAQSRQAQRIQRYLSGEYIPADESLARLLAGIVDGHQLDSLGEMASEARAARVRDRREARNAKGKAVRRD